MLDDLRQRLGYRAALRATRARRPVEGTGPLAERRVLALLPPEERDLRAAWRFLKTFDVPRSRMTVAITAGAVAYAPDAFAANVATVGDKEVDWRGLPRRDLAQRLWATGPHVALDLSPAFSLSAAFLVGASPARFRIGLYSEAGEPFYDLLLAPTGGYEAALGALRGYLDAIEPPVLPFRD